MKHGAIMKRKTIDCDKANNLLVNSETKKELGRQVFDNNSHIDILISKAIDKNVPVETMEKLLSMRRELKAEFSKEEFNKAMSDFQAGCPTIKKTKKGGKTDEGDIAYKYAPIESIVEQTKYLIKKHGFSFGIQTFITDKTVKVTCRINHISGHSESTDIELPLTTRTRIMSAPQVVAATVTFGKRYTFCNGFGIMTGDDDTDGKTDGKTSVIKTKFIVSDSGKVKTKIIEEGDVL